MTRELWRTLTLILALSLPVSATNGEAETESLALEERLSRQEARIGELEGQLGEQMAMLEALRSELTRVMGSASESSPSVAESEEANPQEAAPLAGWNTNHAFITDTEGRNTIELRGRLHVDYRGYTGDGKPASTFLARRMRLGVQGEFGSKYSYVLEGNFSDSGGIVLDDGYFDLAFSDAFTLRAGQFKAPFSQETIQSDNRIMFVERSALVNLVPFRTPGFMVSGSLLDSAVTYEVDAYNGRGRLANNDTSTPEVVGRLRFQPFRSHPLFENFAFGGAYAQGRHQGANSFRGRTASQSVTFFDRVPVRGKVVRANAEFEWVAPRFSVRGEYMQTSQARDGLGDSGGNLPGVVAKGYVVETGYVFGGENLPNSAVVPYRTFLEDGGMGALQVALRYENLQIDDRANPNRSDGYTLGFNWQMSRFVRHMSNFSFERFQNPNRSRSFNGDNAFTYVGRMQLTF